MVQSKIVALNMEFDTSYEWVNSIQLCIAVDIYTKTHAMYDSWKL